MHNTAVKSSQSRFYFHISGEARKKYQFEETLFSIEGRTIFANYQAVLRFTGLFNKEKPAENQVKAGYLNAMGLLDEILHFLIESYRKQVNPKALHELEDVLIKNLGSGAYNTLIKNFVRLFPNPEVFRKKQTIENYLKGKSGDLPNRLIVLEEIIMLWLDNANPAYDVIDELIGDQKLQKQSKYNLLPDLFDEYFKTQPVFGPDKLPLWEMLQQPAKKFPNSISAQLEYIRRHWAELIQDLITRLLMGMDFIHEEEKARFDPGIFGPGPVEVVDYSAVDEYEPEAFSQDLHWMPRLVLIAKSTYVWLDQLSKTYQRDIYRLDQIPDEELERLSRYGFTGLWLIGLWERSTASRKIKQISGNPEAVASAYSLKNYDIARDLGGDEAYQNLRERAAKYRIRLASDMVPNHMGIDSDWVINHPDWFIQNSYPPFPTYSFNGPDLSEDERVGLFIEDGYWNRSDAAVVFKRLDRYTGDTRYIYHGNDGTSMPWNDTAQLNYLIPEVREAVIQTILHVARKFPVIRFDAAMTLAKKHYQRLWFPEPGHGGDIPSRAEHAMTKKHFNEVFPVEFWREVVDRVAQEAPDTLLLAEAFWMMEGYFVRTLGMHRVYNSAFMNMLKTEDNANYRLSVKKTLEYNPQILKRYVNFMNNPDEETAVAQFGKDDKYFGVCMMMCTMPGLPMFGHGQIEGFAEKYGMEYRKAYWDEQADQWLIDRHQREIFPVLKKRYLFSDVENFFLYDFYSDGHVNEDVLAFSNRFGDERALVLYHNKFATARGWINLSAAYLDDGELRQTFLWQGMGINPAENNFLCFHDHISGLEYIRSAKEISERGLYFELDAFKYRVFWDFNEVTDSVEEPWARIAHELKGEGVISLSDALNEMIYRDILFPFTETINQGSLEWLGKELENGKLKKEVEKTFQKKSDALIKAVIKFEKLDAKKIRNLDFINAYLSILNLANVPVSTFPGISKLNKNLLKFLDVFFKKQKEDQPDRLYVLLIVLFVRILHDLYAHHSDKKLHGTYFNKRAFNRAIEKTIPAKHLDAYRYNDLEQLIEISANTEELQDPQKEAPAFLENLFSDYMVQDYLKMNRYEDVTYFNKERFEELLDWMLVLYAVQEIGSGINTGKFPSAKINKAHNAILGFKKQAALYGYRYDDFINNLE